MKISDNSRVVIAVSILVSIVITVVVVASHKVGQDYNGQSLKGKETEALAAKISEVPFGTVIVTKAGGIFLVNNVQGQGYEVFCSDRMMRPITISAWNIVDLYEPHNNLEERRYLLEKFAQGEKVPENWKKAIPKM